MANQRNLSDPIALRLPQDILYDIEAIAQISDRTRSWVIVRALKAYLAAEGRDVLRVAKGRKEIADGATFDLDDILDKLDADSKDAAV